MTSKKLAKLLCCIALCIATVGLLASCGGSDNSKELITKDISTYLDKVKAVDSSIVNEMVDSEAELNGYGITTNEFAQALFGGFDYKIDSVDIEGDKATAKLSVTIKDVSIFTDAFEQATRKAISDDPSLANSDEASLMKKVGPIIISTVKDLPVKTISTSLVYNKSDSVWNIDESSVKTFTSAILPGLQ